MDPVSVGLLAAVVGGAGGEMCRQTWVQLGALVRRPFRHGNTPPPAVSSGEAELVALQQAPGDVECAQVVSTVLAVRAAMDENFRTELERWHEQAKLVRAGDGNVVNEISGGSFHGPTLLGRDISFTATPRPAKPDGPYPRS